MYDIYALCKKKYVYIYNAMYLKNIKYIKYIKYKCIKYIKKI